MKAQVVKRASHVLGAIAAGLILLLTLGMVAMVLYAWWLTGRPQVLKAIIFYGSAGLVAAIIVYASARVVGWTVAKIAADAERTAS
jgi:hypothetical protein